MAQQARNLSWRLEEDGIDLSAVIHDRVKKFAPGADMILRAPVHERRGRAKKR